MGRALVILVVLFNSGCFATFHVPEDAGCDVPRDLGAPGELVWLCSPVRYADGVCDCGCGVPDPDCCGAGCDESDCWTEACVWCWYDVEAPGAVEGTRCD